MSEKSPGFCIYRPVTNIGQDTCDNLWAAFKDSGVRGGMYNKLLVPDAKLMLVTAREFRSLGNFLGIPAYPDEVDALGDYLEETLPDSFDENVTVDTFPMAEVSPLGERQRCQFNGASNTKRFQNEKYGVIAATLAHYGMQEDPDALEAFNDFDELGVPITKVKRAAVPSLEIVRKTLVVGSGLLPLQLELGPICIDDNL